MQQVDLMRGEVIEVTATGNISLYTPRKIFTFSTARIEDSEVVWDDGTVCIRASINELLDSMQMDG